MICQLEERQDAKYVNFIGGQDVRKWGATWEGKTQAGCLPRGRMGGTELRRRTGQGDPGKGRELPTLL